MGDIALPYNARVLAFDGQEFGADPVEKQNGATVFSLWGELAFQADPILFDREIRPSDSRGEAPGNATYRKVLAAASPCLILIDELVSYLIKLKFGSGRRITNQYHQTLQFLQDLLQEVGNVPGVCVLISLPKSKKEFGGLDPAQLQRELGIVDELQARADRVVSKRTPVNDDEIYTLMSKRLFKRVDPDAAHQVARMYRQTYERTRALYDPTVFSADYLQNQIAAYPLHPELIDVLYKKWSTASDFPRTRAVLQLLASIVADQWVERRAAYTIQPAHVNLERERLRTRIVSAAGGGGAFDAVVAADIIGGDAHADDQDQTRGGDYYRHHIARGIATTLLMHSFGGATRIGALPADLRLGTVAPNVGPEYISEVLETLEQKLWYVHREGDLLRFQTKINIYRMIAQRAEEQSQPSVAERLKEALPHSVGTRDVEREGFRVLEWAATDGTVADRPEPTIAVLDPKYSVAQENGSGITGRSVIDQLWEKAGGGFRQWRNALVLIAPDRELWAKAEEAMREVMAYESVLAAAEKGSVEVSTAEVRDLRSRAKDRTESLRTSITTAYRWVFYPEDQGLEYIGLPVPATKDERIAKRIVDRLADQDYGQPKILRKMGDVYFNAKLAPRVWRDEASPLDLGELYRRFPQWTYLPILPHRDEALRSCIREGIQHYLWAVVIGDSTTMQYRQLIDNPGDFDTVSILFDGSASLVRGELLDLIRGELRRSEVGATAADAPPTEVYPPNPVPPNKTIRESDSVSTPSQPPTIPAPQRHSRLRLHIGKVGVAKTSNLQPYLFRVLQEQDAGSELAITIEVTSSTGISSEVLEQRIIEAFDQLGISLRWESL